MTNRILLGIFSIALIIAGQSASAQSRMANTQQQQQQQMGNRFSSMTGNSNKSSKKGRSQEQEAKEPKVQQITYAWEAQPPLAIVEPCAMDTLEYNYFQQFIPSEAFSYAWACTGNYAAEGKNMLWLQQRPISDFFLYDAQRQWIPSSTNQKYYNSRIPFTLLSYNTAGTRDNNQDRLNALFSGNINKRAQIGANMDYLYSKGCYANQAAKGLTWGFNGSYLGEKYEFIGNWNHYNLVNKENGGITDDLYITDPAELQGGVTSINPKQIPTNLSNAHTRVRGGDLCLTNRYKLGYWREETASDSDSVATRTYVPVTAVTWTFNYHYGLHVFRDNAKAELSKFFENTYLYPQGTNDRTRYTNLSNTVSLSLLEGFNKYAKFGLTAFLTYEVRKFNQTLDTLDRSNPEEAGLSPFPDGIEGIAPKHTQNMGWVGARISKQHGSILRYDATGEIGLIGDAAGEVKIRGNVSTRIPLLGDTVAITGYGHLTNTAAPYLLTHYLSNHFIWRNDFGKERRLRLGGRIDIPWTRTNVNIATETLQNYLYFNEAGLPQQHGDGIQVFSANLEQNFKLGILHWDNKLTYQTSTNDQVLPLPKFAIYSNLYLLCRIATLHLQLGVDCDYYTSYYAPAYQPATATFHNQRELKLGNYPFMNAYANMKLGRVRFYVLMSHVNQGLFGSNYFSIPHYPLNPRRFQMGLSVDFWN